MAITFFRITPDQKETKETILQKVIDKYPGRIIVAEENADTNKHYHVLLETEIDLGTKNQNLRKFLKKEFEIKGNEDYSISLEIKSGTEKRVAAYTIKDGCFVQQGYTEKDIEIFRKLSTKKYKAKEFKDALIKIEEKYISNKNCDMRSFIEDYVRLKADYNQVMNVNNMLNYINLIYTRKNGVSYMSLVLEEKFNGQIIANKNINY